MMLVEKALQYISFKLISVYKSCSRHNFNPITGQHFVEEACSVTFKDQLS